MHRMTNNTALDYTKQLPLHEREELIIMLRKQQSEETRDENILEMHELLEFYQHSKIHSQPFEEVVATPRDVVEEK